MTKVKAKLENRGKGILEFAEGTLRFYVERGRLKKKSEVVREIPLIDIENATLSRTELSITWKGVADIFIVEKEETANAIFEEVDSALKKQKESHEKEKMPAQIPNDLIDTIQIPNDLIDTIKVSLETTDSLFDILMSLNGRVDWNRLENSLKRTEENIKLLPIQKTGTRVIDLAKLESAIRNNRLEEISKEVYDNLKSLKGQINELASNNVVPQKIHPDYEDAKRIIHAYYTLNDIIIGTIVGDKEISRERNELTAMLEGLAKTMELRIDVDAIIRVTDRLVSEKVDESLIEQNRTVFKQQFTCLNTK
jgi:hypothetical protein